MLIRGNQVMKREILKELIPITDEEQRFLEGEKNIDRSLYMEGKSDVVNSKKLLKEGKLITVRPHTRFVHFPEHVHDYIEVIYMCVGSTTHIINGNTVKLEEGELLFLSRSAKQEILPAGGNDIAVNFIILPEFFDSALYMLGEEESPLRHFIIDCLRNESGDTAFLHFKVSDILPIQNLVENLIWTLINSIPNKRKINQHTMGLLFLQLLNYTERLSGGGKSDELLLQTLRYIEEHYSNGSLSQLSNALHYDFAWFSREIKRRCGKTYTELVQDKRLSQAAFFLRSTDLNVSDISARVGYSNISYFHRLFSRKYDLTPSEYRRKFLVSANGE